MRVPETFRSNQMPVVLGSPLRVPSYAWRNWGVGWDTDDEYAQLVRLSEQGYREEWDLTTEQGHKDIAEAAMRAGLGDANQRLNEAVADVVAAEVASRNSRVRLLDVGAGSGSTTLTILDRVDNRRVASVCLLDPAKEALLAASRRLRERGLREGRDFSVHVGVDTDVDQMFALECFDVAVGVAALHHHADLEPPLTALTKVLAPGGLFVLGDWHNTTWEHPARVLCLLDRLEWSGKQDDLAQFCKLYPLSKERAIEVSQAMARANGLIAGFWEAYAQCRSTSEPQFCLLEGHRPRQQYLETMKGCGLTVESCIPGGPYKNPRLLTNVGGSHAISVGRKGLDVGYGLG